MAFTTYPGEQAPMAEMNTTPLIDVMLVLLIMFIITMPVASHVTEVPLPGDGTPPPVEIRHENTLSITPSGTITWNNVPLSEAQLVQTLRASLTLHPEPLLRYAPEAQAPYGASARTLALFKQSGIEAFGFVGNEQYSEFGKPAKN